MSKERILVPLAEGFEEIEAVTIIDVLRRAGLDVTVAGLGTSGAGLGTSGAGLGTSGAGHGSGSVMGSHGIPITPDVHLGDLDTSVFTMIVLPGGMPGTRNLMQDERVLALVRRLHSRGQRTAAICAAPLVLHAAGVVTGLPITAHPSVREKLTGADVRTGPRVLRSGSVTTSQGAGSAMEFALALVLELCGESKAEELGQSMMVEPAG